MDVQSLLARAVAHHQAGEIPQAETLYRQVLDVAPGQADAWHLLGLVAHQAGHAQDAVQLIRRAIELNGRFAPFHGNLGEAYRALRQYDAAIACYRRALELDPRQPLVHYNLGLAFQEQGHGEQAVACYRQTMALDPNYAPAHNNCGAALRELGRTAEAADCFRRALQLAPQYVDAHYNLGLALQELKQPAAAIASLRQALELDPQAADAFDRLGVLLHEQGQTPEAIRCFERALQIRPDFPDAHVHLGNALGSEGQTREAVACYERAVALTASAPSGTPPTETQRREQAELNCGLGDTLRDLGRLAEAHACYERVLALTVNARRLHRARGFALYHCRRTEEAVALFRRACDEAPARAETHEDLGVIYYELGRYSEAIASFRHAVSLCPDSAALHNRLGMALSDLGQFGEAQACFERALEVDAQNIAAVWNLSLLWLRQAEFTRGWAGYENRWRVKPLINLRRKFPMPAWDGENLTGKTILVYTEQGFGDTFQFIRYARLLKQRGPTVVVECPKRLVPLLARTPGIDHLTTPPPPAFDTQIALLSLPGVFKTDLHSIPADVPYIAADPALVARWQAALPVTPGLRIGINWQGRPVVGPWLQRDIPLQCFAQLAQLPGVQLISLQQGPGRNELVAAAGRIPVRDLGPGIDQASGAFMDTAAIMMNLDLIITSDTAIPHLAGALGLPVWVALPFAADWRWLCDREDSPWYPTMRLFRQKEPGDWDEVFRRIAAALAAWSTTHG